MDSLAFRLVNSCAAGPFSGNPISVMAGECDERLMQPIARQMNLASTVFPVKTGSQEYRMRLFTPEREVPYAGSPSLAAAWAMGQGRWTQTTAGAVATIDIDGDTAWMEQPEATFEDISDGDVAAGIGLTSVERLFFCQVASNRYVMAVTDDDPASFQPRPDILMGPGTRYGGPALVGAVHIVKHDEVRARLFGPAYGISEDPACGAVAGALATYLHRHFETGTDIVIRQGEEIGRPSRVLASIGGGRIRMGGRLIEMGRGAIDLRQHRDAVA